MSRYEDWLEDQPAPHKELPALKVAPIYGVQAYAGHRNPLTRSTVSKKVSLTSATPATQGVRQVYHFDSEAEYVVALEALLSPDLYTLEVQLAPIDYFCRQKQEYRPHSFDLRLTFRDGFRRAVFVRNASSLALQETQDEIDDIFAAVTEDFANDAVVVCGDDYTRAYRDNLRRIWDYHQKEDHEAAHTTDYWYLRDLVANCDMEPWRAYQASMRLIGRQVLWTDMYGVIDYPSRVALQA